MKTSRSLLLFLFLILLPSCSGRGFGLNSSSSEKTLLPTSTSPAAVSYEDLPDSQLFDLPWDDRSLFLSGLVPDSQVWVTALPQASLYRVALTIADSFDRLTGAEEVLYTNQEDTSLSELVFRLFPNFTGGRVEVENVRINDQPVESYLKSGESTLVIPLAAPLPPGEHTLVQMDFTIDVPHEMGGNYGLFSFIDDVLMLDLFLPTIPAYDQDGWYDGTPPQQGDLSYYDASFYLVRVTAPQSLVLVSSGVVVAEENTGDRHVVTIANGPARDFSLAASERFTVLSKTTGGVRVNSYTFASEKDAQELALKDALQAIETFDSLIGAYEYVEFDVAATPMQAGGIEYPGMTWINADYYHLEKTFYDLPASVILENVIVHEVGHQWFYNTVGNSQVDEPWLDESLVQYITGLYFLDRYGEQAYSGVKGSWDSRWANVDFEEIPIGMPTSAYNGYDYVASVYGRGPYFFEALSEKMGEDDFQSFLSEYYAHFHWQVATGDELKTLAETHCRCDLTPLFEAWVYP